MKYKYLFKIINNVDKLNKLREMKSKQIHMIKTVKQQMIFIEERKVY